MIYPYPHENLPFRLIPVNNTTDNLNLLDDRVYLWRFSSMQPKPVIEYLGKLLSQKEQKRADRYHFATDCRRFIVRRGLLRIILGMVLDLTPEEVCLSCSKYGKPFVDSDFQLDFNLSFSDEMAVIAISKNRTIGIDIERNVLLSDMRQIAQRCFSPKEFAQWEYTDHHDRTMLFYRLWTCKEALVKALGVGLSFPLDNIEITFDVDTIPHLKFRDCSTTENTQWGLLPLDIAAGYSACLAADSQKFHLMGGNANPFHHVPLQIANYKIEAALAEVF